MSPAVVISTLRVTELQCIVCTLSRYSLWSLPKKGIFRRLFWYQNLSFLYSLELPQTVKHTVNQRFP